MAAAVLYAGVVYGIVLLLGDDLVARAEVEPAAFLWVQLLDDTALVAVALAFGLARFPRSWAGLGFRRVPARWWGLGAVAGLAAAAAAWGVAGALDAAGLAAPVHPVETLLDAAEGPGDLVLLLVAVTVPVAIGEETFFRGFAYRLLRARLGWGASLAVTSAGFALVHGLDPGAWLPVVPIGVVLGLLVEGSGSLFPAMAGHAVVNALAVLLG